MFPSLFSWAYVPPRTHLPHVLFVAGNIEVHGMFLAETPPRTHVPHMAALQGSSGTKETGGKKVARFSLAT